MWYYLTFGSVIGLTAGFSPGPLMTLVIAETLRYGPSAGVKVALVPLVTDAPIVLATIFLATQLADLEPVLGVISIVGGAYLLMIALQGLRQEVPGNTKNLPKPQSLRKGILTNFLSPHPYLFWLGIGAPTVAKASGTSSIAPLLFIASFYFFLVGAKVVLAVIAANAKLLFNSAAYRLIMKLLAVALIAFAILLFIDGVQLLAGS
ncbi:MAG: LysE family translocator [Gammaproteobacteria bacterium]